jgi:hypothetical protein
LYRFGILSWYQLVFSWYFTNQNNTLAACTWAGGTEFLIQNSCGFMILKNNGPPVAQLMNSARLHKVFQNFVVPWKIHIYKNLILSSDAPRRDASNGIRVAYVNFYNKWVLRHDKRLLKLQQFPQYENIDYPPVNHHSDLAQNTS